MTTNGWLQIAFFSIALLLITKPLGIYVLKVYDGSMGWLRPVAIVCALSEPIVAAQIWPQ